MVNEVGYRYDFIQNDVKRLHAIDRLEKDGKFARMLQDRMESIDERLSSNKNDKKLLDVCYEMESLFIGVMLRAMKNTIHESDFFGSSIAKDIFRDMLYDEYAKIMARTDQFGIARQIYDQLRVQNTI